MAKSPWIMFLLAFSALIVQGASPTQILAQTCWANCDDCSGGGHSYGAAGDPMKGRDEHGCGGASCSIAHQPCGGGGGMTDARKYLEQLRDAARMIRYQDLSGMELHAIVARSDGLMFLNPQRKAIQQVDCYDHSAVVYNLPLSPRQMSEYARAVADEEQGGESVVGLSGQRDSGATP